MKNKILPILCIFILVSFLFINNSVFAYSLDGNNCVLTIPDALYENIINSEYYNTYDCIFVTRSISCYDVYYIEYDEDLYFYYDGRIYSSKSFNGVGCVYSTDGTTLQSTHQITNFSVNFYYSGTTTDNTYNFYFKKLSLYTDADKSDFFFKAPVMEQEKTPGLVAQKLEATEMEPLKEILTLVPIMIILIVSYLALRKGLTFIKTLRKM